ncbi:M48 family metalloprotease [Amorphus orientalis]|uniref:Zn-dependent protease n=1 Tax=Amorphus orientalis TaxID=649198 RepID=A0AAE3VKZ4_9HYPH|nr:M48 family metalloprotease [Amorphus orientalis]MDQ0313823.1 putative Zn-dependent protease [Amorphus orientalis]
MGLKGIFEAISARPLARAMAACGLLLGLGACVLTPAGDPIITSSSPVASIVPPEPMEAASGETREHQRLIDAYGGVYSDPSVERSVARVVGRLVAASDDPSRSYRITILNSPAINAFALPTGHLYITRGLLALASDRSEVAAVIAHEMAHVTAQHAVARQRRAQAIAVANRVVSNMATEAAEQARQTTQLSLARFSQDQELEADEVGVRTLAAAGFDPFAATRFLNSMSRYADLQSVSAGSKGLDFLSSHPTTPSRIDLARRAARQYGAPGIGEQERDAYLRSLDGMLYGDDPSEGYIRGRQYLHASLGIGFTVPPGYVLKNTPEAVLATDGDRTALRFDGLALPEGMSLTDYLRSGWVKGLIEESVREETVNGMNAATASAIADGWSFRIGVVQAGSRIYRFIFATSRPSGRFDSSFEKTFASFSRLTRAERDQLEPLRIRIATVQPSDTVSSLAARMQGVADSERTRMFEVLNGIDADNPIVPGQLVKIISE